MTEELNNNLTNRENIVGKQSAPTNVDDAEEQAPLEVNSVDQVQTANSQSEKNTAKSLSDTPFEKPKKLADIVPTSVVWISGMIGNHQVDCAGPIELPFKLDKPEWPYTTVAPNPSYTNQIFNYDCGNWVPTDAKTQGQQLTDLLKQVGDLQKNSENHDKSATQSQKMSVQLTQNMMQLGSKMDVIENKLDNLLNSKDSDK